MAKTVRKKGPAKAPGRSYYYAGGERIELTPADDLLAVDAESLASANLPKQVRAAVEKSARPLPGGVKLIERAALGDLPRSSIVLADAQVHPVFRADGALVVVLPEVRIEESRTAQQQRLKGWLKTHAGEALVESSADGRVTLRPASGSGSDALANAVAEEVAPELAQARFVRITPKPSTLGSA